VWQKYLGAILLTVAVVAARRALDPWLGRQSNRHLVFLPTVMVCAWFGGFRAGLVSAVMSAAALYVLWSVEPFHPHLPSADVGLFVLVAVAICLLVQSLEVARATAVAATRARERVLEIVAHDLRGSLSVIKTTVSGIESAVPTMVPRAQRIGRAVGRMESLIRDLVDSTQIEHGELAIVRKSEPIAPLVEEVIEMHAAAAREAGVTLEAQLGTTAEVDCDRGRILQVLANLVGNALKFTPSGGRITVRTDDETGVVRFTVADTGPGIPPQNQPRIFEQYWKSDGRGTGLGLFIARSIVEAHGGHIWVRSQAGQGATFFFTIPRRTE